MHITVRGHHLAITPAIEERVTSQFEKMTKHLDQVCSIQVKLRKDHRLTEHSHKGQNNHQAEVILRLPGKELFAQASADDMYESITAVAEKMRRQIERYKTMQVA